MKVLMLNGNSNQKRTAFTALTESVKTLEQEGMENEIFQIGGSSARDYIGSHQCTEKGCVFSDDGVNNMAWMLKCFEAGKEKGIELTKTERADEFYSSIILSYHSCMRGHLSCTTFLFSPFLWYHNIRIRLLFRHRVCVFSYSAI